MGGENEPLPWRDRTESWQKLGFSTRHANALVQAGYNSLEDLRKADDLDLKVLPNIGNEGRLQVYRVLGREPPPNLRSGHEVRAQLEAIWRSRLGEERVDRLLDEIADMVGDALDTGNLPAAQALWSMARRRRESASKR